jgi:magnesium transporter
MVRTRMYRDGQLVAEGFPVEEVSERVRDPSATVWFDLCAPSPQELESISEELGLHRLAVEDAVHSHQRAKLDRYASHLFITAYATGLSRQTGELDNHECSAFVTGNALVTVRRDDGFDIDQVLTRWNESSDLARFGVSFLLHGLLDYVVDTHFAAVQTLDDEIEALEDQLFDERRQDRRLQLRTFELRKSLVNLRRVVLPMRELVNSLMRRDLHAIDDAMMPYFQDVYDHVLRATEWTDSLRDLVTTIAVPTAVTGFYGQNVPYPGFGHVSGVISSILIIVLFSGVLFGVFKWRGWL